MHRNQHLQNIMNKIVTLLSVAALATVSQSINAKEIQMKKDLKVKSEMSLRKEAKTSTKISGTGRALKTINSTLTPQEIIPANKSSHHRSSQKMRLVNARKVDGNSSVEGTWTFSFGDYYFQTSTNGTIKLTYEATLEEGYLRFEDPTGYELSFLGVYDESASTISFPVAGMGEISLTDGRDVYLKQQPFEYNYSTQGFDYLTNLVGRFNASAGTLSFTSDQGLMWMALESEDATNPIGYFSIYDFEGATLKGSGSGNGGGSTGTQGLDGLWEWTFVDNLLQDSTGQLVTVTYVCTYEEEYDDYYFEDPTYMELPFYLLYDETTGQVTLPMDIIGNMDSYLVSQEGVEIDPSTYDVVNVESLNFKYDPKVGEMVFGNDTGILWGAYDPTDYSLAGYYAGYSFVSALCTEGGGSGSEPGEDEADWTDIGEATFMDGWILPGLGIDQTNPENWYKVPLQQAKNNIHRYRLVDPYHIGPAASYNESKTPGYIVFDVTDPDAVFFEKSASGFSSKAFHINTFYCYNMLGMYYQFLEGDYTPEEIATALAGEIPFTTFKNGVVSLGSAMTEDGLVYDANFGYDTVPNGGDIWISDDGTLVNMDAAIYFPDDENMAGATIIPESDSDRVEYYNLQGIRILNPEAGQILIKRKGDKTEKVIF